MVVEETDNEIDNAAPRRDFLIKPGDTGTREGGRITGLNDA